MDRLESVLPEIGARHVGVIAETAIARIHEVTLPSGPAVLKIYAKGHAGNEAAGIGLMKAWAQSGVVVQILATGPDWVLMERLEGQPLGDLARAGDLEAADSRLAALATRLRRMAVPDRLALPCVADWFGALFDLRYASACGAALQADMDRAKHVAEDLLGRGLPAVPLHGDLHHDNVVGGTVIDAKGVRGPVGYELANALRNPKGCDRRIAQPDMLRRRVMRFAGALDLTPHQMALWGVAKCGLSIAWRAQGALFDDRDAALLSAMRRVAEDLQ